VSMLSGACKATPVPEEEIADMSCCEVAREDVVQTTEDGDDDTFVTVDYVNRRYSDDDDDDVGQAAVTEAMELDVDDIDAQLELALERKQVSIVTTYNMFAFIHQVAVLFRHNNTFLFNRQMAPVPACWLFETFGYY